MAVCGGCVMRLIYDLIATFNLLVGMLVHEYMSTEVDVVWSRNNCCRSASVPPVMPATGLMSKRRPITSCNLGVDKKGLLGLNFLFLSLNTLRIIDTGTRYMYRHM